VILHSYPLLTQIDDILPLLHLIPNRNFQKAQFFLKKKQKKNNNNKIKTPTDKNGHK
jgi:hypothetical protein